MKKIKSIIVDDEFAARNILNKLMELSFPEIEIVALAEDLLEAVSLIKEHKPDLVFLDVEMPNYAGYEISSFFEKIDFHIIFVTAYNQYAMNAFEINAVDYLLKPIDRLRLKEAIERVKDKIKSKDLNIDYKLLKEELENNENKTISLTEAGKKHIIKLNSIIAISADGAYSQIYLEENKKLMVSKNIGQLEKVLEEFTFFIRTHKSWLVNQKHLKTIDSKNNILVLTNKIEAKVSRYKKEALLDTFHKA